VKKLALIPMKARIAEIQSVYASAAGRIIAALSSLEPDTYTAVKSGTVLSQVKDIIGSLDTAVQMWAPPAIRAVYEESAGVARTRLEMIGAKRLPAKKYNPARHDKKIAALTKTVMTDYWKANRTIEKTARKYLAVVSQAAAGIKRIEQVQMFDPATVKGFINRIISASLVAKTQYNVGMAHLTSKDIAAKIRAKLLSQLSGENFITINGRDYNLRFYAELVARTRMRESQTEAVIESMKEFGEDLVEIPRHDNPCKEICAPYQGQIYSISGNSSKYEKLPDGGPPWHPCCEDIANPVSENALAWRNR